MLLFVDVVDVVEVVDVIDVVDVFDVIDVVDVVEFLMLLMLFKCCYSEYYLSCYVSNVNVDFFFLFSRVICVVG